ncbi:uncharacterized protein [Bemisia tabaci]|uniref:uncharacterized protein n=1 Tax=Bemisia tabaci TaxID=7038 RepID=UPI003B27EA22
MLTPQSAKNLLSASMAGVFINRASGQLCQGTFHTVGFSIQKISGRRVSNPYFFGDALAFCFTLLGYQATRSTSVNLFSHSMTSSPIILHHGDYSLKTSAAPVSFDIIDTSNLIDSLGPLNLLALGSSLLKCNASSSLYTEMLFMLDRNPVDRLSTLFGVDVRCMALLLGLVLPDLFTNAINSVEDHRGTGAEGGNDHNIVLVRQVRSRLRWKRSGGYRTSPFSPPIQVEAKELAKLLIRIHNSMFKSDELLLPADYSNQAEWKVDSCKLMFRPYTRASFAFLLSVLKNRVISDWDACLKEMYDGLYSANGRFSTKVQFKQELALNMKLFGVDTSLLSKPNPEDINQTIFASIARQSKDLPDQVCVTLRVPRKDLAVLEKSSSSHPLVINICGVDEHGEEHRQSFSCVQIMFGKRQQKTEAGISYPFFEEDSAMLSGSSDMYASVLVPTSYLTLLLKSKKITPLVECGLKYSSATFLEFAEILGLSLHFSFSQLTSGRVSITRFMPGMPDLPNFISTGSQMDMATSDATVAHFSDDGLKLNVLVKRITLESEAAKTTLADISSEVKIKFKSPWIAIVSIAKDFDFQLEFPVPMSALNPKLKIARKSSYIEVEASLLNPLVEDAPVCMFPCLLMKFPCGMVPVPWTSPYIDLDVMPAVHLDGSVGKYGSWIHKHASEMFSARDHQRRKLNLGWNSRMILKQGLLLLHMVYSGYRGRKTNYFGLRTDKRVHTLFFPSCLRLDLARNTTVLDCALIQLTNDVKLDPLVSKFLKEIKDNGAFLICVTETENIAWKSMMAVMAERCRTWEHRSDCEYALAGEAPLSKGLRHDRKSSICSCGIGKFPEGYLKDEMKNFSNLDHILNHYGTRVALSLVFSAPHVEKCGTEIPNPDFQALLADRCEKCGSDKKENGPAGEQALFNCSKCKSVKYCSVECQKSDWKMHKKSCKA